MRNRISQYFSADQDPELRENDAELIFRGDPDEIEAIDARIDAEMERQESQGVEKDDEVVRGMMTGKNREMYTILNFQSLN